MSPMGLGRVTQPGSNPAVGAPAQHVRLAPVSSLYLSVATGRKTGLSGVFRSLSCEGLGAGIEDDDEGA